VSSDSAAQRDDRILPATHWASLAIVVILIPAFAFLWGAPGHTADLWAWPIKPEMSAIFMGAGYGAGAYFFTRVFLSRRWHPASPGVLAAAVFAALMLIPTFTRWDRFNHGDAPFVAAGVFYGWVAVYILSPLLVGALWAVNQQTDPRTPEPGDPDVPRPVRGFTLAFAVLTIIAGVTFLASPSTAIKHWPWTLTPLTAQVIACFTIQVGVGALQLAADRRWSSWRLLLDTFLVAVALMLIGAARAWDEFDHSSAYTWLFVAGLAGTAIAVIVLSRTMATRSAATGARP
jgi:hypothetical protein